MNDTICAISTALGVGAISIIRLSGPEAISIVNSIFKGKDLTKVSSHTINYGFINYKGEKIDEVLVSIMKSPKTFTTEDVVEINSHGGIATTQKILEILLELGARLAEPGEFTKRAFLNGRIDLIEAEAVGDLISSETDKARKLAINQLSGYLTLKINEIRKLIIDVLANLEVNIDYPEYEEGEDYTKERFKEKVLEIKNKLNILNNSSINGRIIKTGVNVALLGKPNVGKSSLLNILLEEEKAIVTNIPGTTRDLIEGKFSLNGIQFNIIDTAGLRDTDDLVESIGVKKSIEIAATVDLVIYVLDNSKEVTEDDLLFINKFKTKNKIIFINKNDLESNINLDLLNGLNIVYGNTLTLDGIKDLKNKIIELFNMDDLESKDFTFLSNVRQINLVNTATGIIEEIFSNIDTLPIDVFTIDLRRIYDILGEIIGEVYKDDLLDEMFSKFCLGK